MDDAINRELEEALLREQFSRSLASLGARDGNWIITCDYDDALIEHEDRHPEGDDCTCGWVGRLRDYVIELRWAHHRAVGPASEAAYAAMWEQVNAGCPWGCQCPRCTDLRNIIKREERQKSEARCDRSAEHDLGEGVRVWVPRSWRRGDES